MSKRNSVLSALLASAVSFAAILATADGASAATKPMLCIFLPLCQTAPVPPPPPKMIKHHHRHHHTMKKKHK
jgi:hypothetical protein